MPAKPQWTHTAAGVPGTAILEGKGGAKVALWGRGSQEGAEVVDHSFLQEAGVFHALDKACGILYPVIEQFKVAEVIVCQDKEELGICLEVFA